MTEEPESIDWPALDLAFIGIKAAAGTFELLAKRGLVSPAEVEQYALGIVDHLQADPDDPDFLQICEMRAHFETTLDARFVAIRELARRNWKG